MLLAFSVYAQEPPSADITYDVQIQIYGGTWADITPVSIEVMDGPIGVHKTYTGYGVKQFEAESLDSTPEKRRKVVFTLDMVSPGAFFSMTVFQVRLRSRIDTEIGTWSAPSDFVACVFIPMLSGKPIHIGE